MSQELKRNLEWIAGAVSATPGLSEAQLGVMLADIERVANRSLAMLESQQPAGSDVVRDAMDAKLWRWMWNRAHNVSFYYHKDHITKVTVMGLHCGTLKDAIVSAMASDAARQREGE